MSESDIHIKVGCDARGFIRGMNRLRFTLWKLRLRIQARRLLIAALEWLQRKTRGA